MFLRCALWMSVAIAIVVLPGLRPSWAETAPTPPPSSQPDAAKPDTPPATPTPSGKETPAEPGDVFGEDVTLSAKPIVYLKSSGTWDNAFETITGAFKKLKGFAEKEGLKIDGPSMSIFTAIDDAGFQFEAAIPVSGSPKSAPQGDISVGTSPAGHALKFVHRGSYDGLENTYEAITNYLDEKRLDSKDMYIEEYVTDPLATGEDNLVINVFVMIK